MLISPIARTSSWSPKIKSSCGLAILMHPQKPFRLSNKATYPQFKTLRLALSLDQGVLMRCKRQRGRGARARALVTLFGTSWPGLSRPSTSSPYSSPHESKTWMPGIKPGMTRTGLPQPPRISAEPVIGRRFLSLPEFRGGWPVEKLEERRRVGWGCPLGQISASPQPSPRSRGRTLPVAGEG